MTLNDITHRYQDMIKIAKYLGASDDMAQDIAQECFLKLGEIQQREGNIDRITYNGKLNMTYIFSMVKNIHLNICRVNNKTSDCEIPEIKTETNDLANHVKDALNQLGLNWYHKRITEVYLFQGYSIRELAKETTISPTNIFHTLKHSKAQLRKLVVR